MRHHEFGVHPISFEYNNRSYDIYVYVGIARIYKLYRIGFQIDESRSSAMFAIYDVPLITMYSQVPYEITNSVHIATSVARIAIDFVCCAKASHGTVVELGAGACKFGFHLACVLRDAVLRDPLCPRIKVILTDFNQALLIASAVLPCFKYVTIRCSEFLYRHREYMFSLLAYIRMHSLKGLVCRTHVPPVSSLASSCSTTEALASPAFTYRIGCSVLVFCAVYSISV